MINLPEIGIFETFSVRIYLIDSIRLFGEFEESVDSWHELSQSKPAIFTPHHIPLKMIKWFIDRGMQMFCSWNFRKPSHSIPYTTNNNHIWCRETSVSLNVRVENSKQKQLKRYISMQMTWIFFSSIEKLMTLFWKQTNKL